MCLHADGDGMISKDEAVAMYKKLTFIQRGKGARDDMKSMLVKVIDQKVANGSWVDCFVGEVGAGQDVGVKPKVPCSILVFFLQAFHWRHSLISFFPLTSAKIS